MELELVTFEQAKALKELGFPQNIYTSKVYLEKTIPHDIIAKECGLSDWQCISGKLIPCSSDYNKYGVDTCSCPIIEFAAKWLREEKNIIIQPCAVDIDDYLIKLLVREYDLYDECYTLSNKMYELVHYNSWEEALSAGIDKAIELLKEE